MTKEYKIEQLRNVVLLGHGSSGKTSLSEAMLYNTGVINRLGRVDDGTTTSDYDEEEISRKISINASIIPCEWQQTKINVLDVPGYIDFVGEVRGALRVADCAVVVLDAVSGVEVGTELMWQYADEKKLPRLIFVNKMNRDNANLQRAITNIKEKFEVTAVPFQLPIGSQAEFKGVVDLVSQKAYIDSEGKATDIPADMSAAVEEARVALVEAAAETDDDLILKYLEGETLTSEEIITGLKKGIQQETIIPVLCGSATENIGIKSLMNMIIEYMPSPAEVPPAEAKDLKANEEITLETDPQGPLAALVFKTFADPYVGKLSYFRVYSGTMTTDVRPFNPRSDEEERVGQIFMLRGKDQNPIETVKAGDIGVIPKLEDTVTGDTLCEKGTPLELPGITFPNPVYSVAITPKTKTDLDKLGPALNRLVEEDPTLSVRRESSTSETILDGMGQSHIDIATRRLNSKFGVDIITDIPKVPYKETIKRSVEVQGKHKKQSGGHGQYGDVWIRFEPLPRGSGFEFENEIFGGAVPKNYIPAVEKGMVDALKKGVLAGFETVDLKATLYDGSYHSVDSSDMAFRTAASLAYKRGVTAADPILLEPIMNVEVTVPEQFMGDVMGDLSNRRGRVQGTDQRRGNAIITAQAPLGEMQRYATDLRSLTQGRGLFTTEFAHYEEVPRHIMETIIEEIKKEAEEA